ncbi:Histone deacetylase 3 [Trichinella nativa]|uniref:Histone deacetylase n=1 Tax=Trichinella nativa TaxID=6335 RepID=A0A0V1LFS7_9BILA|nr:Histone deacetylase 3 [Trichinella nativa]
MDALEKHEVFPTKFDFGSKTTDDYRKRVVYFSDDTIGNFSFTSRHLMKPFRAAMTDSLVQSYGLTQCMKVTKTEWASEEDLKVFHTDEYIEAIKVATKTKSKKRGGDADCPEFFGVLEYCRAVAGSSLYTIGNFSFTSRHLMKPFRAAMTDSLVQSYGLTQCMKVTKTEWASEEDLKVFHTDEYIEAIKVATKTKSKKRGGDADCPEFFGVLEYCRAVAGSSLSSARVMNARTSDIIINWNGGMHHAKSYEASGFCFINDIVLAILELLKVYDRVLYVDIDCHHGDGVEEAFYTTNRVMTVSFHKYGDFFPGSGRLEDTGLDEGEKYAVNVPLNSGIGDANYVTLFRMVIITKIVEHFRPSAIVMQCGADSLAHDRLGCFNLSVSGHGECVKFVRSLQIPLMLLGGGGYSLHNVARCWTYETSIALDVPISNDLPFHEYYNFYSPSFKLHLPVAKNVLDMNGTRYLEYIRKYICENMRSLEHAPSVEIKDDRNSESSSPCKDSEDNENGNPPEDSELLEIFEENVWLPGIDGIVHHK